MIFDRIFIVVSAVVTLFCYCQRIHCEDNGRSNGGINHEKINELFDSFNREVLSINHRTAELAWDTNFRAFDNEKSLEAQQFVMFKFNWSIERCRQLEDYKDEFDKKQARMFEIQCMRQPKFTGNQRRNFYQLSAEVEKVFTDTQICIPHYIDICSRPQKLLNSTFIKFQDKFHRISISDNSHVSIQPQNNPDFPLRCFHGEPDLERMMSNDFTSIDSKSDPDTCKKNRNSIYYWIWESWRLAVGPRTKPLYINLIELENDAAINAGYPDIGEIWKHEMDFGDENVDELMDRLMTDVQPLYDLLTTFVKTLLETENLPAHLLGWNANWATLYRDELSRKIFPNSKWNIDQKLISKNWSTRDILKRIEDFYTSTGLPPMTNVFWNQSLIGDNLNNYNCHGTAADMYSPKDYRIVACSVRTLYDFYVIVHEMGHIEQFMLAEKQSAGFRAGNSIVQETIGDSFFLAMMTPMHLNRLNLIDDNLLFPSEHNTFDIEMLMVMAFLKLPDIPFGYVFERFRYDLYSKRVNYDEANNYFWELTKKFQRVTTPSNIDRSFLFDASAKFHLSANVPYSRYFFGNILQFQVMKAFCTKTVWGTLNATQATTARMPLHKCDIYGSKRVGNLLKKTLSTGSSTSLKEILKNLTGSEKISADGLLEYFEPLKKWIEQFLMSKKIKF